MAEKRTKQEQAALEARMSEPTGFRILTPCARCARRDPEDSLVCQAFPDGIPQAILDGEHQHTSPFPGDGGKQFIPRA